MSREYKKGYWYYDMVWDRALILKKVEGKYLTFSSVDETRYHFNSREEWDKCLRPLISTDTFKPGDLVYLIGEKTKAQVKDANHIEVKVEVPGGKTYYIYNSTLNLSLISPVTTPSVVSSSACTCSIHSLMRQGCPSVQGKECIHGE